MLLYICHTHTHTHTHTPPPPTYIPHVVTPSFVVTDTAVHVHLHNLSSKATHIVTTLQMLTFEHRQNKVYRVFECILHIY